MENLMNFGTITIWLSFISVVISGFFYFKSTKTTSLKNKKQKDQKSENNIKFARSGFYGMVLLVSLASAFLFYLFLTHQFQYKYVYGYSSKSLPLGFLISSFWAGQEGSFLFWALLVAWLGVFFIKTAGKFEAYGMFFLTIIQVFFLAILTKASPFFTFPQIPPDGAGLNPLLQNFWMVIHPPVLFLGYAAASFPFVIALAAMIQKDFDGWIKKALPWTIFTSLTLGAGIILGAFWAYETLGWGGYWGWDPVENSSLIPWLTVLALLHSMIVQNMKGSLKKTNFILTIVTFILIIYATFLTRSGILSDFSVHSFSNLGISSFLIIFMAVMTILGFGIFFLRQKDMPVVPVDKSAANRENGLLISIYIFIASAVLTFLGTSSPIITGLLGNPSQVDISFYNKVNLPVAILMALFLGIIPFLTWIERNSVEILKRFIPSLILTILSGITAVYFGVHALVMLIFVTASAFAFWTNTIVVFQNWKKGWHHTGAPISHIGVGMIMIAIIISGSFDDSERVVLEKGKTKQAMGYNLTYKGLIPKPDGKDVVNIEVDGQNRKFLAQPRFFYNAHNRGMMREPDVDAGILEDLYISPLERREPQEKSSGKGFILKKGETSTVAGYDITFSSFSMSSHSDGTGAISIGADLEIDKNGEKIKILPKLILMGQKRESQPVEIRFPDNEDETVPTISLTGVNADSKSAQLVINGIIDANSQIASQPEQLIIEISKKPFMNILWAGTVILLFGTFISLQRRILT
jgi:cytochrome c-type biogenesis protein CcmF